MERTKKSDAKPADDSKERGESPLLKALEALRCGLTKENKSGVRPQDTAFLFLPSGRVVTWNGEMSVSAPIPDALEELKGKFVPAYSLLKLLGQMGSDEVEVEVSKEEVQIKSGRTKAGVPINDLPDDVKDVAEEQTKWKKTPTGFTQALSFSMYACSKDFSIPALTCVHIHDKGQTVEGADNFRATRYILPSAKTGYVEGEVLIPAASVKEVVGYDVEEVASTKTWVAFRTKEDIVVSCRTFLAKYPDLDSAKLFDKEKDALSITLPQSLGEVLDRAQIFAARDYFLEESIKVTLDNKRLKIRAEGSEGWLEEDLNFKYSGPSRSFQINPTFLKDMIEHSRDCVLGPNKLMFSGDNWTHAAGLTKED